MHVKDMCPDYSFIIHFQQPRLTLKEEISVKKKIILLRLACGSVCERLSSLTISMGEPRPLWMALSLGRWECTARES